MKNTQNNRAQGHAEKKAKNAREDIHGTADKNQEYRSADVLKHPSIFSILEGNSGSERMGIWASENTILETFGMEKQDFEAIITSMVSRALVREFSSKPINEVSGVLGLVWKRMTEQMEANVKNSVVRLTTLRDFYLDQTPHNDREGRIWRKEFIDCLSLELGAEATDDLMWGWFTCYFSGLSHSLKEFAAYIGRVSGYPTR